MVVRSQPPKKCGACDFPGLEHGQLQPPTKIRTSCDPTLVWTMALRTFTQPTMVGSCTATRNSLCTISCRRKLFQVDICDGGDGEDDDGTRHQPSVGQAWARCSPPGDRLWPVAWSTLGLSLGWHLLYIWNQCPSPLPTWSPTLWWWWWSSSWSSSSSPSSSSSSSPPGHHHHLSHSHYHNCHRHHHHQHHNHQFTVSKMFVCT